MVLLHNSQISMTNNWEMLQIPIKLKDKIKLAKGNEKKMITMQDEHTQPLEISK